LSIKATLSVLENWKISKTSWKYSIRTRSLWSSLFIKII